MASSQGRRQILARLLRDVPRLHAPIAAILAALVLGALAIKLMGISPLDAYANLVRGSLGSRNAIGETLVKASPLVFTGLSFALAFRCGLINMGAEGQLYLGAIGSVLVGVYVTGLPAVLHLPLAVAAGFIAGGLWGLLAGWLKVKFGASEIITTVMFNYVAVFLNGFLVTGPIKEAPGVYPQTALVASAARLPRLLSGTRLHLGFVLAIAGLVFYYMFLWHTAQGFQLRGVGLNAQAARYAGMNPSSSTVLAMFLAGGMAGLAGAGELLGVQLRLREGVSQGFGYDGIAVAFLGANHPLGMLLSALLFGMLRSGGNMMKILSGVPVSLVFIVQALVIMFVVAYPHLRLLRRMSRVGRASDARRMPESSAGGGGGP